MLSRGSSCSSRRLASSFLSAFSSLLVLGVGLLVGSGLGGCRKKNVEKVNLSSSVAVMKPYTEDEKRVRKTLSLVLKVYEPDGVQAFDIILEGKVLWRKSFTSKGQTDVTIKTDIDLSKYKLDNGRQTLIFRIRDHDGVDSISKTTFFYDSMGPSIAWIKPEPQTPITQLVRAELTVKDLSKVAEVRVYADHKLIKKMVYAPYLFALDPSDFSSGIVNFRVVAEDGLGNTSARNFAFEFAGGGEGSTCMKAESCKSPLLCVKKKGADRGFCRKPCRLNRDCKAGYLCRRVGRQRACMPTRKIRRKRKWKTAGLMEKCSPLVHCRKDLLCVQLADYSRRCLAICGSGYPSCPKKSVCKKAPRLYKKVCVPLRRIKPKSGLGERCSKKQECKRGLACIRAPGKAVSRCYRKCQSKSQCRPNYACQRLSGQPYGICLYKPYKTVGPYQTCSVRRKCRYGLQCISTGSFPQPRCFPACKGGRCGGGSLCVTTGGYAVCLRKCNPQSPVCPANTRCGGVQFGSTYASLCR